MPTELLLPDSNCLRLDFWAVEDGLLILCVSTTLPVVDCPYCQMASDKVHSYYLRRPADLPCVSYRMRLNLCVRRFYCRNDACEHGTFSERIPSVVAPYARRTARLCCAQTRTAFAIGGEEGARLLHVLCMPASADTLLRLIRQAPEPRFHSPRVVGVDDWAMRKGQTYGTILVDLESQNPIDLLPDRTAESLALWLQDHPEIEIISRDRGSEYIKGATLGAPDAVQVADRFHLLQNLREAGERFLETKSACLKAATQAASAPGQQADPPEEMQPKAEIAPKLSWAEQDKQARRQRRQERYDLVRQLHGEGLSHREIDRQLHMSYHTVAKYINADRCPVYPEGLRHESKLDPFLPYLEQQWQAGRRNASQLWREIRQQGFAGSRGLVARWAAQERKLLPKHRSAQTTGQVKLLPPMRPTQAVWLLLKPENMLTETGSEALLCMKNADGEVAIAHQLIQAFIQMLEERRSDALTDWLRSVAGSGIAALKRFANGLRKDFEAVKAAFELPWSQGQVEGHVNRLKFIKRSMYGRGNFDLLRKRVLGIPTASPG